MSSLDLKVEEVTTGRWGSSTGSRSAGQATEVQRGVVTYAMSHSLVGSLELDDALASEGPRVLPEALEHLEGRDLGRRVGEGLSSPLRRTVWNVVALCGRLWRKGPHSIFSFPRANACVYILLISVCNLHFKWIGLLGRFFRGPDLRGIFQLQCCCSLCDKQWGLSESLMRCGSMWGEGRKGTPSWVSGHQGPLAAQPTVTLARQPLPTPWFPYLHCPPGLAHRTEDRGK